LIPTFQAQALLDEINSALNLNLTLTGVGKEGLVIDVGDEQLPRPVYLGRSSTRDQKAKLESKVPRPLENWGSWAQLAEPGVVEDFQRKVNQSLATIKIRKNNSKQAAQEARKEARTKKLQECLARVQAYFGLRPALQPNVTQPSFANGQIEAIDVLKPVKWAFQDAPIFISVDIEWMDRYGILTEVGISTLDMLDLEGVVPGDYGHMWMKQIRTRHLRVREYRNWINETYTIGCPDSFRFGKSEIIPSADIGDAVDAAFRPPYMVPSKGEKIAPHKNQKRTVILVGLGLHGDIVQLQRAGSQVFLSLNESYSVVRETIDVAELYRINYQENQTRGLQALLGLLNILSSDLHNAGNDAHYTLQALVRLMLRVAGEKPWGYEPAQVSDKEYVQPDDDRKDMSNVTVEPQEQRKERIARAHARLMAMCEQEDGSTKEGPVWSH
jgi:hypothetical protein